MYIEHRFKQQASKSMGRTGVGGKVTGYRRPQCLITVLLCAVALANSSVSAQRGPQRVVLLALDTNGDGNLSAVEIENSSKSLLTLDRNGDGQITSDEVMQRPEQAGASPDELVKQLLVFDQNGDGVLTTEELPERLRPMLARGDTNHDGKLTTDEIRAMAGRQSMPAGAPANRHEGPMQSDPLLVALDINHDSVISAMEITRAPQSLLMLDKNGDGEISAQEMRPRQQTPAGRVDHLMGEWDTNKDGQLSKAEAPDRMQQQFETIDKNGDGFLDREELLQYFNAQAAQSNDRRMNTENPNGTTGDKHP